MNYLITENYIISMLNQLINNIIKPATETVKDEEIEELYNNTIFEVFFEED